MRPQGSLGTTQRHGRAGQAARGSTAGGAAPAWKQPWASKGWRGAGWAGRWVTGGSPGVRALELSLHPSLSPLFASWVRGPLVPWDLSVPRAGPHGAPCPLSTLPSCWQLLLRALRGGSSAPWSRGQGLGHHPGTAAPPRRHLRARAGPVTGTPGAGPYRTSHLAPSPLLPCLGQLPGGTARCQVSVPGGLS